VLFDFLLLGRPQLLFAFDLATYQENRELYVDYDALDFGLHPRTTPELVEMITSGAWRSSELTAQARARRARSLPEDKESFAAESVRVIEQQLPRAE
jgi:CDP-glycerol glycerophosphotransferase (TagB/SpsB family)